MSVRSSSLAYRDRMTEPEGYVLLGWGPTATGSQGWAMSPSLFARCPRCADMLSLDPAATATCSCGCLAKDADAGRFGSSDVDNSVAVYRKQ
jgi:hypothetical protein